MDEARSPLTEYWNGKLNDHVEESLRIPRPPRRATYDPRNFSKLAMNAETGHNSETPESSAECSARIDRDAQQSDFEWHGIFCKVDLESNLEVRSSNN